MRHLTRAEIITAASSLEHLFPMVLQKLRMRALVRTCRHEQAPLAVPEPRYCVRQAATCDWQAVIIIDRYEAPIEHPLHGCGQRHPITDAIWSALCRGADMRGLNL